MQIFKHLPWFHWVIVEPFYTNNLRFESDKHIEKIKSPIMILHAEDDGVIPFFLAEKVCNGINKYMTMICHLQLLDCFKDYCEQLTIVYYMCSALSSGNK